VISERNQHICCSFQYNAVLVIMRYGSGAQLPRYKEGANRGAGDRQGQGGQADAGGARGLEYSLGIRRYKTLNTRRIQL